MFDKRKRDYEDGLRDRTRELRHDGLTYSEICEALEIEIPKSTINNWVKDIELTPEQKERIEQKERDSILRGQPLGAEWNREQKRRRLREISDKAAPIAERLAQNKEALMLMASALYMGEGAKAPNAFSFGNSDPRIIQAWLALLRQTFDVDESKFRCQLAISEGMDEAGLREFWSEITSIPATQFIRSSVKADSGGRKRDGYKGVCIVTYHSLEVRRMLDAIGQGVIDDLLDDAIE
ncbi:MAG: hypothetical protein HY023_10515 [Chloroflexi bacterium]|nr:hypothetical protein [Chloroflexota bacterium]MBI3761495.1 hypothetical protein [Chloroflexota bacterium]